MYPHLRGADIPSLTNLHDIMGVSPPAWGRQSTNGLTVWQYRCIPTCVGQTDDEAYEIALLGVYPHLRGADGRTTCPI